MAEYVTETEGIPEKKGIYFIQIYMITLRIDFVVLSQINSNEVCLGDKWGCLFFFKYCISFRVCSERTILQNIEH